jgi:hypothetical protein
MAHAHALTKLISFSKRELRLRERGFGGRGLEVRAERGPGLIGDEEAQAEELCLF